MKYVGLLELEVQDGSEEMVCAEVASSEFASNKVDDDVLGVEAGGNRVAKVALLELDMLVQEVGVRPVEVTLEASIGDCASGD